MTEPDLVEFYSTNPFLYHVTDLQALDSIRRHGLLTAKKLEKLPKAAKRRLRKRMGFPEDLEATLAKQGMIIAFHRIMLSGAWAVGATPPGMKNEKVFFFATMKAALEMAEEYRNHPNPRVVLAINTRPFVEAHFKRIELASYHTGIGMLGRRVPLNYPFACKPQYAPFRSISDYPYSTWSKVHGRGRAVRELAVAGSVTDIFEHVVDVVQVTEGVAGEPGPWWSWFWRGEKHWTATGHAAPAPG